MKKIKVLTYTALASLALVGCEQKEDAPDALVEVGDIVITKAEFYDELKASIGEDTLRQMTLERLLKEHYKASEKEIQAEIKKVKIEQGFKSDSELEKALKENDVTLQTFKENMEMKILLEKASVDGVKVAEKDLKAEYDRVKNQVRASHILVKERSLAEDLYEQLEDGADFEKLAEEHSIDSASSINGGDLGFFGEDYIIDAIEKTAFSLNVDEISKPIETSYGFHIIKVTEKNRSYDELKETLKESLTEQRKKTADEVFDDLMKGKDISIYDGVLKDALN